MSRARQLMALLFKPSWLGATLVVIHGIYLASAVIARPIMSPAEVASYPFDGYVLAARETHLGVEPFPLWVVGYSDLPSWLVAGLALVPFRLALRGRVVSAYDWTYVEAWVLLLAASLQWWALGGVVERRVLLWRTRRGA